MHASEIAALHMEAICTSSRSEVLFYHRSDKSVQLPRASGRSVGAEALGSFGNRCCLAVNEVLKDETERLYYPFLRKRIQYLMYLNRLSDTVPFLKTHTQRSYISANLKKKPNPPCLSVCILTFPSKQAHLFQRETVM